MKPNKIIMKHLLPGTVIVSVFLPVMLGLVAYSTVDEINTKQYINRKEITPVVLTAGALSLLVAVALLSMIIGSYKDDYKFASHSVREFLKQEMKNHPEFKTFEHVLSNPRALRSVATVVSNSLRDSEQKRVLSAIAEMNMYANGSHAQKAEAAKRTQDKIIKIVKEHAAVHPDFINEVYAAMAYADTTHVIPAQQNVR